MRRPRAVQQARRDETEHVCAWQCALSEGTVKLLAWILPHQADPGGAASFLLPERRHRVLVDVSGDCAADFVAGSDGARKMHPAPDPRVVAVRTRPRDAGVGPGRQIARRRPRCQRERLCVVEMTEEDGRRGAVLPGMSGRIFRWDGVATSGFRGSASVPSGHPLRPR